MTVEPKRAPRLEVAAALASALALCTAGDAKADEPAVRVVSLRDVLRMAAHDPPAVLSAVATLERIKAQESSARAAWFPVLGAEVNAGVAYQNQLVIPSAPRIDSESLTAQGKATLDWSAVNLPRQANIAAASQNTRAQRFATKTARLEAMQAAAELYVRAQASTALTADAKLTLKRRTDEYEAARDLVRAGLRPPVDAERTRVDFISAQRTVDLRAIDEQSAAADLAVALGRDPLLRLSPRADEVHVLEMNVSPAEAKALAIQNRPELTQLVAQLDARRADHDAAIYARLPTAGISGNGSAVFVNVLGGAGVDGSAYAATGVGYLRWQGLDPSVWSQGAITRGAVEEAQRQLDAAALSITASAVTAAYTLARANAELQRTVGVLEAATATREAQNGRYRAGVASLLEVLDAESIEQQARLDRIQAQRDFEIAGARVLGACGTIERLAQ